MRSWLIGLIAFPMIMAGISLTAPEAKAARWCKYMGRKYSIYSTRCTRGSKYRCVAHKRWKYIGRCGHVRVKPARFCRFRGRTYTVHSTRCTKGWRYRCVRHNHWKRIGRCRR